MKLAHAIRVSEKLLESDARFLSAQDQVALTVLTRFAKRVLATRESVRALAKAVMGEDELNQEDLFATAPRPGERPLLCGHSNRSLCGPECLTA
jgi:hypothetical protein